MHIISTILASLGLAAISITQALGYPGLAFLMALESMVVPLPSELVLPFAGYLIGTGHFTFWLSLLAATIGSLIGSLISYAMGYYGGEAFIKHIGKYVLLNEEDLVRAETWFKRRGEITIFFCRFVPVIRHLISIPAGIGRMNLTRFSLYTILGAGAWNAILLYAGLLLGASWPTLRTYTEKFSILIAAVLVIIFIYAVWHHFRKRGIKMD